MPRVLSAFWIGVVIALMCGAVFLMAAPFMSLFGVIPPLMRG